MSKSLFDGTRDAMLNIAKVKLELILDLDMCKLFEKRMRGGLSYVFNT